MTPPELLTLPQCAVTERLESLTAREADLIAAAYLENRSFSRVDARSAAQFTVLAHDLQVEQIDGYPGPVGKAARDAALAFATFGRVETVVTTKLLWAWTAPDRGGDA